MKRRPFYLFLLAFILFAPVQAPAAVILSVDGVWNVRDLGGYGAADGRRVAFGKLYRSGALDTATTTGLSALGNDLKVRRVIDFRTPAERARAPDRRIAGAEMISDPVGGPAADWSVKLLGPGSSSTMVSRRMLESAYARGIATMPSAAAGAFRQMFDRLLAPPKDGATLIHCDYGVDRTGIATVLLLSALGVSETDIAEDFAASNGVIDPDVALKPYIDRAKRAGGMRLGVEDLVPLVTADPAALEGFYRAVRARYGSIDGYLRNGLGLDARKIDRLRALYTEPVGAN